MLLFRMKDFEYGINPNNEVLYEDKDNQFKLMLCLKEGQDKAWILKLNENVELVYFIIS